jgi:hypothetical protein
VELVASDFIGPAEPDPVEVTAVTAGTYASVQILAADQEVASLDPSEVTTAGNQNALLNFLSQALVAIDEGDNAEAIQKLEKAIQRTDGCALRGSPDGNGPGRDWISTCDAQAPVYQALTDALDALTP